MGLDFKPETGLFSSKGKGKRKWGLANTDHGRHLGQMGAQRLAVKKD
jgi:hypothetical protein